MSENSCVLMMSSLGCTEFASAIPSQKRISAIKILELLVEENIVESWLCNAACTSIGDKKMC